MIVDLLVIVCIVRILSSLLTTRKHVASTIVSASVFRFIALRNPIPSNTGTLLTAKTNQLKYGIIIKITCLNKITLKIYSSSIDIAIAIDFRDTSINSPVISDNTTSCLNVRTNSSERTSTCTHEGIRLSSEVGSTHIKACSKRTSTITASPNTSL